MSLHRYAPAATAGDLVRGLAGLIVCLLPLLLVDLHWVVAAVFGVVALLFALFALRAVQRLATVVEVTDRDLQVRGPGGTALPWSQISGLSLRYFSTRRDRKHGWMHLKLRAGGRIVRLESGLTGFETVVERAAAAARANRLAFSETTRENLAALGLDGDRPTGGWFAPQAPRDGEARW